MRPRIAKGRLVYSTNRTQFQCLKALVIEHHYNPLTFSRIRRVVIQQNISQSLTSSVGMTDYIKT